MCLLNYTSNDNKNKTMSENELGKIEVLLDEGYNCEQIGIKLGRNASTIRKEINKYKTYKAVRKDCSKCKNYSSCNAKQLCGKEMVSNLCTRCKGCKSALEHCENYIPTDIICERLKGQRKVCNGCEKIQKCAKSKVIYNAEIAIKNHKLNQRNSVKKIKISNDEKYKEELANGIKRGLSPEIVLNTMEYKPKQKVCVATVYSYIDKGILNCCNIDLRIKTKLEQNKDEKEESERTTMSKQGRTYADYPEEYKHSKTAKCGQMDTVEGKKKTKTVLLTLLNKETSFLFAFLLKSKTKEEVVNKLNEIEKIISTEKFNEIFGIMLTDNGTEFKDIDGIELSADGISKRIKLYFADAYASYQKGTIENQHRLLRYFLPKGTSFENIEQSAINEIINKINNYPRKWLNYSTPYKAMENILGKDIMAKLGYYEITIDKLYMKREKVA